MSELELFTPVTWPEIQSFMEMDGFYDNSYLINDDRGLDDYGSSAYMVSVEWLKSNGFLNE